MFQLLENFEAECYQRDKAAAEQRIIEKFSLASTIYKTYQMPTKQLVHSSPLQADFYKMMNSILPHLDISQRIFQIDDVWVDQKTLTVSMMPGCWMNPHTLDCYSKRLNTYQLHRGRQGLLPSDQYIAHVVGREDMDLLMRPMLNLTYPACSDMLSEATVGFSLENANFIISIISLLYMHFHFSTSDTECQLCAYFFPTLFLNM